MSEESEEEGDHKKVMARWALDFVVAVSDVEKNHSVVWLINQRNWVEIAIDEENEEAAPADTVVAVAAAVLLNPGKVSKANEMI